MECKLITKVSYPAKQIAPVEINIFSQYWSDIIIYFNIVMAFESNLEY